jgi:hypothetical protein
MLDTAPDGDLVHCKSALRHHLFQIAHIAWMTSSKCRPRNGAGRVRLTVSHYQKLRSHLQQIHFRAGRSGWSSARIKPKCPSFQFPNAGELIAISPCKAPHKLCDFLPERLGNRDCPATHAPGLAGNRSVNTGPRSPTANDSCSISASTLRVPGKGRDDAITALWPEKAAISEDFPFPGISRAFSGIETTL